MAAADELKRLLARAGVTPYRRVGKVRAAYDPRTPNDTVRAALAAVGKFAPALVDVWGEPAADVLRGWHAAGMAPADVCDDPCPRDVDPATCPAEWLAGRCGRYHFRLTPGEPGKVVGVGVDGWDMAAVRPLLPAWFVEASRRRVAELAALVAAPVYVPAVERVDVPGAVKAMAEAATGPTVCGLCGKNWWVPAEDIRLAVRHPWACDRGGQFGGKGKESVPGCPFKEREA